MSDMKAFPSVIQYFPNDLNADEEKGMTLRDYFAAKAMQGMLTASENYTNDELAGFAYIVADAMLKAREEK